MSVAGERGGTRVDHGRESVHGRGLVSVGVEVGLLCVEGHDHPMAAHRRCN